MQKISLTHHRTICSEAFTAGKRTSCRQYPVPGMGTTVRAAHWAPRPEPQVRSHPIPTDKSILPHPINFSTSRCLYSPCDHQETLSSLSSSLSSFIALFSSSSCQHYFHHSFSCSDILVGFVPNDDDDDDKTMPDLCAFLSLSRSLTVPLTLLLCYSSLNSSWIYEFYQFCRTTLNNHNSTHTHTLIHTQKNQGIIPKNICCSFLNFFFYFIKKLLAI